MFYYKNWNDLCAHLLKNGVLTCTAAESLAVEKGMQFVVLKHDVEGNVSKAHKLAQTEKKHGIRGSYYVQGYLMKDAQNVKLLQEIQSWGHEISYHYDVLDACSGDYEAALKQFAEYLKIFNEAGFVFTTVCQHGNPVKKRIGYTSNRDFFRNAKVKALYPQMVDMVVNYSKHTVHEYKYISDAGYCWNIISEPETNDLHAEVKNVKIGSFANLKYEIDKGVSLVISTHPHRWKKSALAIYARIYMFKVVRAVVKTLRQVPGFEWLMNKFYFLAKKI
jgi:hypothetical protein